MMETATSSGLKAASAVISARPARLIGLMVGADGTNAATVIIYDNATTNSGKVLAKVIVDATATHENVIIDRGIEASNGLYAALSGTGAEVVVLYAPL